MAKSDEPVKVATEGKPTVGMSDDQVPQLFALVAMYGLIVSGTRSEKPMGRKEHDEWLADRAWSLAAAMQAKQPQKGS